ncbi:UDP-2,3-diacylglucosamine diphosphatase [Oceanospirillum sediminis]|uniref:UDP-2,3-diacylglucosamine hydrolase n=1 Tax=Oceanospirillum sediminis TaxID=2760088 RepID=A0A839ISU2_9GAMM|nr:UDP-2,3-diacylglucosamine diphosphatase [Oceanospirillum sediminis]MBB1488048.1 UDP-2,3-diacylglucosamine diphosphatase [Oceanospirillum sediminis]
MKQLFISDLHLQAERSDITDLFTQFIQHHATSADELYILGDFFEYWVGDDHTTELSQCVAQQLKQLSKNTRIFYMAGNRDFLLAERYASQCGMTILSDPWKMPAPQQHLMLSHGDYLCTDDAQYQAFRAQSRSEQWQTAFLSKPLTERIAFAEQARQQSQQHQQGYLTDVNELAVTEALTQHNCSVLIHGHTHNPGIRKISGTPFQRMTLSDWDHDIYYLEIRNHGTPELKKLT